MIVAAIAPAEETKNKEVPGFQIVSRRERIRTMLSAVVWFVSGNIAFAQFNNQKLDNLVNRLNPKAQLYRNDKARQLLSIVYTWALERGHEILGNFISLSTTFDLWTSIAKQKYIAVTYHGIRRDTFVRENLVFVIQFFFCDCINYVLLSRS